MLVAWPVFGQGRPRNAQGLPLSLAVLSSRYEIGTVIVSETVLSSRSVSVAPVKWTSLTVAVHIGFGHELGSAFGVLVPTVKRN